MSYQSPKTQSPQKQETAKKLDEKPTQPEPSLSELEAKKKEAMERLTLKQREFDFISKLGKEDLNVFIQGKNIEEQYSPQKQRRLLEKQKEIAESEKKAQEPGETFVSALDLPRRRPNLADVQKTYERIKADFYEPISKPRQHELAQLLAEKRKNAGVFYNPANNEDIEAKYNFTYQDFLNQQLKQEIDRRKRNKELAEAFEMRTMLKEKQNINKPQIWNVEPLKAQEAIKINELLKKKLAAFENKGARFEIDFEHDITQKVDAYLKSQLRGFKIPGEPDEFEEDLAAKGLELAGIDAGSR